MGKTRNGRSNPHRPPKKDVKPRSERRGARSSPSGGDPRRIMLGSRSRNDDIDLMQQFVSQQNFPVMAPDVGLPPLTHASRIDLIAALGLEPTLVAVVDLWARFDIAMTTDWKTQSVERRLVDAIDEPWGRKLAQRISQGDVVIVPRAIAQLVREVLESADTSPTAPGATAGQVAELLMSLNSEHNTNEYSSDGTLDREGIARIQDEIFALDAEQTVARLRDYIPSEVASVLADAPQKLEMVQGNFSDTWDSPWPESPPTRELGRSPAEAFAIANGVGLTDVQRVGQFLVDEIKAGTLRFSRTSLEASGASAEAIEYCVKEMSCPIEDYRDQLSRERQQGSIHQQRFTMTRFPFLRTGTDEIIVLRYQWVVDRFFGQMLYWPTFAGLPGFRFGRDPKSGSKAESFSAGMNFVFERTVGDSLANIVRDSRSATMLITENELQQAWSSRRGGTASACDWVVRAGRICLVIDATNHRLASRLTQGLGDASAYAEDIEETFTNPNEKFEQLAKSIRRLSASGQADFGLAEDTIFLPVIVVPDGGVPNTDSTDLDFQLRSQPHMQEFDGRILAPAILTLTMLQLLEGVAEYFGNNPLFPDAVTALASWRRKCMETTWPIPFDVFIDQIVPARPIPTRILSAASTLAQSLRTPHHGVSGEEAPPTD